MTLWFFPRSWEEVWVYKIFSKQAMIWNFCPQLFWKLLLWKYLLHADESSLCSPCQLLEHINSLLLDFQADACFHDQKAPAVCRQRLPRICWLCTWSWGITEDAKQPQSHRSEQLGQQLSKIPLPVKMAMYPTFHRLSSSLYMAAASRKLKTKSLIVLSCTQRK